MSVVLNWNGKGIPDELRALPPGRYVIEAVDEAPELTDDEQEGIEAALASVRQGKGISLNLAKARVDQTLIK
jgi:hypothetical protein